MAIIKRRKTSEYAQIHNNGLQTIKHLGAVGLLGHLMSLPEDWEIIKSNLYDHFTRKTVDPAFKILMQEGYLIGGWGYGMKTVKGGRNQTVKQYEYMISDIPFRLDEVQEFYDELCKKWTKVQLYQEIPSTALIVQYEQDSSDSADTNKTVTKETPTKETVTIVNSEVNKFEINQDKLHKLYLKYKDFGIDKKLFFNAYDNYLKDIPFIKIRATKEAYFEGSLKNIVKYLEDKYEEEEVY
jgi:hypothetical protein